MTVCIILHNDIQQLQAKRFEFQEEIGNLADWELGRLGTWGIGNLGDWELGRLGTWEIGNLGDSVGLMGKSTFHIVDTTDRQNVSEGDIRYLKQPETVC
jgi:hypothetical protein